MTWKEINGKKWAKEIHGHLRRWQPLEKEGKELNWTSSMDSSQKKYTVIHGTCSFFTWFTWISTPWKRRFLFEKTIIFRFHIKPWGCSQEKCHQLAKVWKRNEVLWGGTIWVEKKHTFCVDWRPCGTIKNQAQQDLQYAFFFHGTFLRKKHFFLSGKWSPMVRTAILGRFVWASGQKSLDGRSFSYFAGYGGTTVSELEFCCVCFVFFFLRGENGRILSLPIFYVHPYLGKIPILTNIFQRGWNHQPDYEEGDPSFLKFQSRPFPSSIVTSKGGDCQENVPRNARKIQVLQLRYFAHSDVTHVTC